MDWVSQEIGIAAALSRDPNLIADYASGDFYTSFGTRTGFLPEGATKATHGGERDRLKRVCLGLGYGLGADRMTTQLEADPWQVRQWISGHRLRYRVFWDWLDNVVCSAYSRGWIRTRLGWQAKVPEGTRPTAIMNWSMQAHGAEMLRLAVIFAIRAGLKIIGPVHDALLLEAPADCWQDHARELERCMALASQVLLPDGFAVPAEGADKPIHYPNRYMDKRGKATWDLVMGILAELEGQPPLAVIR
jgi:DNA polymerase I-like protein with 3'-5' exonuclease and polymerase domains